MNKSRKPMTSSARKKVQKAIKSGEKNFRLNEASPHSDEITAKDLLKKYPKKMVKTEKPTVEKFIERMEIKKKKKTAKHSKRTTPGEVEGQPSGPAYEHREGKRWDKTLVLQNKVRGRALVKKMSKKK